MQRERGVADRSCQRDLQKERLDKETMDAVQLEVELLGAVKHENVVVMKEVISTEKVMYVILELLSGGELFDRIQEKQHFSEGEAAEATRQIAAGLRHLHDRVRVLFFLLALFRAFSPPRPPRSI